MTSTSPSAYHVFTMEKLTETQLSAALATLPTWSLTNGQLVKTWQFPDFLAAIAFVNRAATQAETANHHPDIDIRYNKVKISLSTHDANGISTRDVNMAKTLDAF
jgi:4a-hydroxytetrahydrobiopterin dehydratase